MPILDGKIIGRVEVKGCAMQGGGKAQKLKPWRADHLDGRRCQNPLSQKEKAPVEGKHNRRSGPGLRQP
jgi:hypothetical protein